MNHRGPSAGGVRVKPNSRIQFDFMLDDVRYRPTVRRVPTTQNLLAARERLAGIRQRVRASTFFFDQEFPDCRFLERVIDPSQVRTCNQVFDLPSATALPGGSQRYPLPPGTTADFGMVVVRRDLHRLTQAIARCLQT